MDASARILVDCRWLSAGGPGRATSHLLRGLAEVRPPGRWLLWGGPGVAALAWPGAEVVLTSSDPRAMFGQRAWLRVPDCDLAVFLHQIRPMCSVPSLTWIHDTIQLRFAGNRLARGAKTAFLRRIAAISREILTPTEYAKSCIHRDLGVGEEKITVAPYPFDDDFVARVLCLREARAATNVALYVGRFASHKNLPRLVAAFGRTDFRRAGGRLVLVGGSAAEIRGLGRRLTLSERSFVELRPRCSQAELDGLFATSLLAVQPSLDEGFGLPAWEALSCGLPLCVSDGGALPEVTSGLVQPFPATSIEAMASAIDGCAQGARDHPDSYMELSYRLKKRAPSLAAFGVQVHRVVADQLR